MPDFHSDHADPNVMLNCVYTRQLVCNDVFHIDHMSDEELRQSIIEDILSITIWEKQHEKSIHFGYTRLFQFVTKDRQKRIKKQMKHAEICDFITIKRVGNGTELRIVDNHQVLQAAMDYCGVWYTGFKVGAGALSINRERIAELGGIDAVVDLIAMDLLVNQHANAPTTTTTVN